MNGLVQGGRQSLSWRAVVLILLTNLIPVVGVIGFGWDAAQILILYWCENLAVGLFTLPRILTARGEIPPSLQDAARSPLSDPRKETTPAAARGALGCFFVFHYGLFCLVHGVFAVILATSIIDSGGGDGGDLMARTLGDRGFQLAVLAAVLLHAVIFLREWIFTAAWRTSNPPAEMMKPYGRILVLHMTVLFGTWALTALGAPASAILILCLVKTVIELMTEARGGLLLSPLGKGAGTQAE